VQAEPPGWVAPGAVTAVAGDRAAAGGQLGADLVLAPGVQAELDQTVGRPALDHAIAHARQERVPRDALVAAHPDAHSAQDRLIEPIFHDAFGLGKHPFYERQVTAL
jgi:hypothetical protein